MLPDHYATLGVTPSADQTTVRAAYLRIMRANHPDLHPGDVESAERARRANIAYAVLSDPQRRADYDRRRRADEVPAPRPAVDGLDVAAARIVAPEAQAYSTERLQFRRSFTLASLRYGLALFAVGLVLLLAFTPR